MLTDNDLREIREEAQQGYKGMNEWIVILIDEISDRESIKFAEGRRKGLEEAAEIAWEIQNMERHPADLHCQYLPRAIMRIQSAIRAAEKEGE